MCHSCRSQFDVEVKSFAHVCVSKQCKFIYLVRALNTQIWMETRCGMRHEDTTYSAEEVIPNLVEGYMETRHERLTPSLHIRDSYDCLNCEVPFFCASVIQDKGYQKSPGSPAESDSKRFAVAHHPKQFSPTRRQIVSFSNAELKEVGYSGEGNGSARRKTKNNRGGRASIPLVGRNVRKRQALQVVLSIFRECIKANIRNNEDCRRTITRSPYCVLKSLFSPAWSAAVMRHMSAVHRPKVGKGTHRPSCVPSRESHVGSKTQSFPHTNTRHQTGLSTERIVASHTSIFRNSCFSPTRQFDTPREDWVHATYSQAPTKE